jgi:diguanylate cyclase (GGDEF)-like protein
MANSLHILLVEDNEDDALLIVRELRKGGYSPYFDRVDTPESLQTALSEKSWDVIVTDHSMPHLNSETVLRIVNELEKDIPVIIVSGIIPEATAVANMKAGAQDYIMKDNLTRLIPAIERELTDARVRNAKRKAESTITHMAYHDALTNLDNRSEFERRLQIALENSWQTGQVHALLYIDLDRFRLINDTCGHVAGDILLKQLSQVLKQRVRESDSLARLGGDEFGVLLESCPPDHALQIAHSVLNVISEYRFVWKDTVHRITASIGFTEINSECASVDEILSDVDMACFTAKDEGRNRIRIYTRQDDEISRRKDEMQWVSKLNQALEKNQFQLYEQSILPVKPHDTEMNHTEFLVRLIDDDGNIMEPELFVPAAEHYNLMPRVDRWVIDNAFAHLSGLLKQGHTFRDMGVYFINVSGSSINEASFYEFVTQKLKEYELPNEMICFEVTETTAMGHYTPALDFIANIRKLGCRVAIDDFGSGLCSFSYLKSVPVDYVKIDGGFVCHMVDDPMDYAIVEAINQIGHIAGLQTIAEYVESDTVMYKLKDIGVDYAQGNNLDAPHPIAGGALPHSA